MEGLASVEAISREIPDIDEDILCLLKSLNKKGETSFVAKQIKKEHESNRTKEETKGIGNSILIVLLLSVIFLIGIVVTTKVVDSTNKIALAKQQAYMQQLAEENARKENLLVQELISYWNSELSKPLTKLTFDDFSSSPIGMVPQEIVGYILATQSKYSIPASLISAQMWVENRAFDERAVYIADGTIIDWKQDWNKKRNAYDIMVKRKTQKNKWVLYKGEVSLGLGQRNIGFGAHDMIHKDDAFDAVKSIDFVGERWRYIFDSYSKYGVYFVAMAYNNPGSAKNAREYMLGAKKSKKDKERAMFLINYAELVMATARNQRLIEIYHELFDKYMHRNDIPAMELIHVDEADYRAYLDSL